MRRRWGVVVRDGVLLRLVVGESRLLGRVVMMWGG